MNWGFGALATYQIQIAATAYKGPGKTNPTAESGIHTLTFAVGPMANWQEFAFGYDPWTGTRLPVVAAGLGLPVFSMETVNGGPYQISAHPRRKALTLTKPLSHVGEFSNLVDAWVSQPKHAETVSEFTGDQAVLNAVWEKVRVRQVAATSDRAALAERFELKGEGHQRFTEPVGVLRMTLLPAKNSRMASSWWS